MHDKKRPYAITLAPGTSKQNHTGSWRTERPVYRSFESPCNHACPAGEPTKQWIYELEAGNYEAAWRILTAVNPFPAIMGRVCYHPCETACNRSELDEPVNIHALERFLGDEALRQNWQFDMPTPGSFRVAIIGAGPSGLAAAYHLRRLGIQVTLMDEKPEAGGMMRYGIPAYRLPRKILQQEIGRLLNAGGIEFRPQTKVTKIEQLLKHLNPDASYDAVFLAIGAHISKKIDIPAVQAAPTIDALSLLANLNPDDRELFIGRKVAVYGGGNTAMDAARSARRLGASDTIIIYRRDLEHSPADRQEIQDASDEGVQFHWLSTIQSVDQQGVHIERMQLDEEGRPVGTGEFEVLGADTIVLAIGQEVESDFLRSVPGLSFDRDGTLVVDHQLMTGCKGVFAGGDMIPKQRTVTTAIGHGHRAAMSIRDFLYQQTPAKVQKEPVVDFKQINHWYFGDAPRAQQELLAAVRRQSGFEEVVGDLDRDSAIWEARRCFSCGSCFACDNCYGVCPDNAIRKLEAPTRYLIDYDYCKGCGLCAQECPCHAIDMVVEESF